MAARLSYSAAQVRAQDLDRFHLALLAPADVQADLLALAAFNLELARTASRVSDQSLGLIRLQWWHEVVDELTGSGPVRRHQVALAMGQIRQKLDPAILQMMIRARQHDLAGQPFSDLEGLRAYLMQTCGGLLQAQAGVLDLQDVTGMANHLGCAYGFVTLARRLASGQGARHDYVRDWQAAPSDGLAQALGQAAMHLERADELRQKARKNKALGVLFKTGTLVRFWLKVFASTPQPLGRSRFARPISLQMLRLLLARA